MTQFLVDIENETKFGSLVGSSVLSSNCPYVNCDAYKWFQDLSLPCLACDDPQSSQLKKSVCHMTTFF